MGKVYERTENGATAVVTVKEAMTEVNYAMMDGARYVREMSSGRGQHSIDYTDGRHVYLVEVEEAPERTAPAEEPKEWSGTASHGVHVHRFGDDLRAVCNRRIRSRGAGTRNGVLVGHDALQTRTDIESSEHADLYTFCPKCEAKGN